MTMEGSQPKLNAFRFWLPLIVCFIAMLAVPVAFVVGAIIGNTQIYNNFASHQQARIEAYLAEDPQAFSGLHVEHASNGWALPMGFVESRVEYDRLAAKLHDMFGDELSKNMMGGVECRH